MALNLYLRSSPNEPATFIFHRIHWGAGGNFLEPTPPGQAFGTPAPISVPQSSKAVRWIGVVIGMTIFAGLLLYHVAVFVPRPPPTYGTAPPPEYQATILALGIASMALLDFASGLSVAIAWIVGTSKADIAEATRRGVFTFAIAFFVAWLVISTFAVQALASLIRFG